MIVWEQWWVYTAHSLYQLYKIIKLPKFIVIVLFNKSALMKTVNSTCSAKYSRCVDFAKDFYEKTMKQIWNSLYYFFQIKAWVNQIRETWHSFNGCMITSYF